MGGCRCGGIDGTVLEPRVSPSLGWVGSRGRRSEEMGDGGGKHGVLGSGHVTGQKFSLGMTVSKG